MQHIPSSRASAASYALVPFNAHEPVLLSVAVIMLTRYAGQTGRQNNLPCGMEVSRCAVCVRGVLPPRLIIGPNFTRFHRPAIYKTDTKTMVLRNV
jgi:hypothetical protein